MPTPKTRIIIYIIIGLVAALLIGAVMLLSPSTTGESVADLLSLGNRFLSELNYEQALVQFLRVIEIEPRNAQGYYGAARAHIGLGRIDEAIDILRQGIEMTGDAQLQALLDELLGEEPTEATPTNVREPEPAPFTQAHRAFIDRICDAILAEYYEYVLALMESQEMLDILLEHGRSFFYKDVFLFSLGGAGDRYDDPYRQRYVIADKTQDGTGILVSITAFSAPSSSSIVISEHRNGIPDGNREHIIFDAGGGPVQAIFTGSSVNGFAHGEDVFQSFQFGGMINTHNFESGFYVQLGPPNAEGRIPAGVREIDGSTELIYHSPEGPGFTEPIIREPHWIFNDREYLNIIQYK